MKALLCAVAIMAIMVGTVSCQSLQPEFVPSLLQVDQVSVTESSEGSEQISLSVSETSEESTESIQQIPSSGIAESASAGTAASSSNPYESAAGEESSVQASVLSNVGSEQTEQSAAATVSQNQSPAPGPGMGSAVTTSSQSAASSNSDSMVQSAGPGPSSSSTSSTQSQSGSHSGSSSLLDSHQSSSQSHSSESSQRKRVVRPHHTGKRLPETDVFGEAPHTDLSDDEVDIVVRNVLKAARKSRCARSDEYCQLQFKNCKDDKCRREVSSQSSLSRREKHEIESLLHN